MFSQREDVARLFDYTAGGFRDFTRIAASDPVMWRDIMQLNTCAISEALAAYQVQLAHYQTLLAHQDWQGFAESFNKAKQTRDQFLPLESH
jgi:prephenate dehydrogenase